MKTATPPIRMIRDDEPAIALPVGSLITASIIGAAAPGAIWTIGAMIGGFGWNIASAGLLGAGVVIIAMIAGLLVLTPWKARPIAIWGPLWLGGILVRLVLTPLLAWVLYSATSIQPEAFGACVGITYITALLTEVSVLARFVRRAGI